MEEAGTVSQIIPTSTGYSEIRRFADSGIQSAIDKAVNQLPEGAHGAVIAFADKESVRLATVARLGVHWSIVGVLKKDYSGPWSGEAAVRFQW